MPLNLISHISETELQDEEESLNERSDVRRSIVG
jgi:hypothetical protein